MAKHFEDKDALSHVMQKRVEGMSSVSEMHGTEMPGYLAAANDACKDTAVALLLVWLLLLLVELPFSSAFVFFLAFGLGWVAYKGGRAGRLGWARLERLHQLIEQEKYEIEHHRPQEREELMALYRAKGFEGKLLEDIVDVLMSDQDRLLKVMLEEEMGLTLQAYEHPLQQAFGAVVGALISLALSSVFFLFLPAYGMWLATFLLLTLASLTVATHEKNRRVAAVIWNLSITILALGITYFLFKIVI